ncbi:hypothetical protein EJ05DRAFT_169284 [Pseudovirgaria hyperparasitica]|uniref:Epidermal growth factor receptor-like transmembrane-juxtamembrane segment domain-containing protein n=1 Tax=Pseudovirgaria hyperparasitica TaxID=470096 RepID=A0A6A6VSR2_9PEZI|nr:uncharacterized protein EJ05DRAFT_169284 [Pseudovirgaria hyperparasitica]KAF2753708.1 hypothetical protein EJ05DRAFT_169284 [Pseudovirgaria hyperparasitica]
MAEPQDSITTFSGRRCTRTRRLDPTSPISSITITSSSLLGMAPTSVVAGSSAQSAPSSRQEDPSSATIASFAPLQTLAQTPTPSRNLPSVQTAPVSSGQDSPPGNAQSSPTGSTAPPAPASDLLPTTQAQPSEQTPQLFVLSSLQAPDPSVRQSPQPSATTSSTRLITSISSSPSPSPSPSSSQSGPTVIGDDTNSSPASSGDGPSSRPPISVPIAGGVVAGLVGIALVAALVFLCFRRRRQGKNALPRRGEAGEKGDQAGEIDEMNDSVVAGAVPSHARTDSRESESTNTAGSQRRSRWSHSTGLPPNSPRSRAMSAPVAFRSRFNGLVAGIKTRMDRKKDSPPLGHPASPSPNTESLYSIDDPFLDPIQPLRPAALRIVNPDTSKPSTPIPKNNTSQPIISSTTITTPTRSPLRNPFADPSSPQGTTPEYLRHPGHSRTQSLQTALHSHPPTPHATSFHSASLQTPNPNAADYPHPSYSYPYPTPHLSPAPSSPLPNTHLHPAVRPLFTPHPSPHPIDSTRTSMTTPYLSTARRVRGKSDPFDLDRPEVLGFGNVSGRREVQDSVTRPALAGVRKSSTPGWGVAGGPEASGNRGSRANVGMAR